MNEDINEEWLSDKSRFACDGLKRQRLTHPMVKDNTGQLRECSWEEAIITVAKVLDSTPGEKVAAVAGGMADAEVGISQLECLNDLPMSSFFLAMHLFRLWLPSKICSIDWVPRPSAPRRSSPWTDRAQT